MARLRRLPAVLLDEPWFQSLSPFRPCGQALAVALAVGPVATAVPGVAVGGVASIAEVLRWPVAGTRRALDELVHAEVAIVDADARLVFQPWAMHANHPESDSVVRSWARAVADLPACALRDRIRAELRRILEADHPSFVAALEEGWKPRGAAVAGSQAGTQPASQPASQAGTQPETLGQGQGQGQGRRTGTRGQPASLRAAAPPLPLDAFHEADRPVVEAIRAVDLPAWRGDPAVTPPAIAALRALAPELDLVAAVRRCAAWWTSSPGKVRGRRSCVPTLRTWVQRDADDPRLRTASPDGAIPRSGAPGDLAAADFEDYRRVHGPGACA